MGAGSVGNSALQLEESAQITTLSTTCSRLKVGQTLSMEHCVCVCVAVLDRVRGGGGGAGTGATEAEALRWFPRRSRLAAADPSCGCARKPDPAVVTEPNVSCGEETQGARFGDDEKRPLDCPKAHILGKCASAFTQS